LDLATHYLSNLVVSIIPAALDDIILVYLTIPNVLANNKVIFRMLSLFPCPFTRKIFVWGIGGQIKIFDEVTNGK